MWLTRTARGTPAYNPPIPRHAQATTDQAVPALHLRCDIGAVVILAEIVTR